MSVGFENYKPFVGISSTNISAKDAVWFSDSYSSPHNWAEIQDWVNKARIRKTKYFWEKAALKYELED